MAQPLSKRKPASIGRRPVQSLFPRGLFEDWFDQYMSRPGEELAQIVNVSMDVVETQNAFEVKVDLPGINPDDVDIQIDSNTLTIRGQRQEESEEKDEERHYHRLERYTGSFARSVVLPNSINEDEAVAEFRDGVLKIVIPKVVEARPRKINITS
jgi:HSP20 family protein